jgi:hypothetical protein
MNPVTGNEATVNNNQISQLADKAMEEFWDVITKEFPAAKSGDLSPDRTIGLRIAAEEAIEEWIANNVPSAT